MKECQEGELNSRPRAYESPALPLSYPGDKDFLTALALYLNSRPTPNAFGAALPLSYPGVEAKRFGGRSLDVNVVTFSLLLH